MNNYETVFILTPDLSEAQVKEAVAKFVGILKGEGAEIVNEENWGAEEARLSDPEEDDWLLPAR